MLDPATDDTYPPAHKSYWNATDAYLMGNVTPGDMRAIIQSQESKSPGGGLACIDLLNRMWDCRTKRRINAKQVRLRRGRVERWEASRRTPQKQVSTALVFRSVRLKEDVRVRVCVLAYLKSAQLIVCRCWHIPG